MADDDIMKAVRDWWEDEDCLCPQPLQDELEQFCQKHAHVFPDLPKGAREDFVPEQSPEGIAVYESFKALLEQRLDSFLKSRGVTAEEFAQACEKEQQRLREFETGSLQWICSLTDYATFYRAMVEVKAKED
eukprot:TRINITY_DN13932_c1_g4_i1.p1 TRINITY_DN13932_c1_g4~~TRINITY_DN13932_c1_g4_i1.p1  ORF type:complete len:155 (+),score=59.11 TRINITY_DN13932_c1_g4_i1:70-465(+)